MVINEALLARVPHCRVSQRYCICKLLQFMLSYLSPATTHKAPDEWCIMILPLRPRAIRYVNTHYDVARIYAGSCCGPLIDLHELTAEGIILCEPEDNE